MYSVVLHRLVIDIFITSFRPLAIMSDEVKDILAKFFYRRMMLFGKPDVLL